MEYRQLLIARKDLGMKPGKLAAQVAHASNAFMTKLIRDNVVGEVFEGTGGEQTFMKETNKTKIDSFDIESGIFDYWINGIFTKTVCQAKNKNQLMKAVTIAEELGLKEGEDFWLIKDNCLTDLEPEEIDENGVGRTLTCVGFKPLPTEIAHQISKKFHLYV